MLGYIRKHMIKFIFFFLKHFFQYAERKFKVISIAPSMFLLDSIALECVNQGGLWSKGTVKEFPY